MASDVRQRSKASQLGLEEELRRIERLWKAKEPHRGQSGHN
jgi:hypothetical protein